MFDTLAAFAGRHHCPWCRPYEVYSWSERLFEKYKSSSTFRKLWGWWFVTVWTTKLPIWRLGHSWHLSRHQESAVYGDF